MSFPRYPTYKPSGVEWLGEVPEHWEVKRIASLYSEVVEAGNEDLPVLSVSIHHGVSDSELSEEEMDRKVVRSEDRSKYKRVAPGDIVYNMMRAWQGAFGSVVVEGMVSPAYVVARPKTNLPTEWIEYLLRTEFAVNEIKRFSRGITDFRLRLYWDEFKNLRICAPPAQERASILRFLDHETAKIDALIAEQQRLIELLQEKRQDVISHAVTKGLNPDAPMKDSGVEWLGEVPEHWEVCSIRRVLLNIEQGWSPECLASPAEEGEWGVVKAGCVNGGAFNQLDNKTLPHHLEPPVEYEIQAGDLLMSRASGSPDLIGSAAFIDHVRPRLLLSDKTFRLRTAQRVDPRYLSDVLGSTPLRQQIRRSISGAVGLANNLPQSEIKDFIVPLPPVKEQQEIHKLLVKEKEDLNTLLDESESLINLLQERRSALISAAVTGQIDVRGLVSEVEAA